MVGGWPHRGEELALERDGERGGEERIVRVVVVHVVVKYKPVAQTLQPHRRQSRRDCLIV